MPQHKRRTVELPSFDTMWKVGAVIIGLVFGYIEFEKEMAAMRYDLDLATTTIEELVEKHIVAEDRRYEAQAVQLNSMEEEIKWYQKNLSINPLSWKKKKK